MPRISRNAPNNAIVRPTDGETTAGIRTTDAVALAHATSAVGITIPNSATRSAPLSTPGH